MALGAQIELQGASGDAHRDSSMWRKTHGWNVVRPRPEQSWGEFQMFGM